jgi:hypothetical protein
MYKIIIVTIIMHVYELGWTYSSDRENTEEINTEFWYGNAVRRTSSD